ncbi:MAG: hypothetical protein ACRD82_16960 [Blastocatellia bacterium]
MPSNGIKSEIELSILVTVVSGKAGVRRCLEALRPQVQAITAEIIVPYDAWSPEVGELKTEFPEVCFHLISDLGAAASADISSHQHRLYDRRRAVGLSLVRGRLIAMTEDLAVPAPDWIGQIMSAHKNQPYSVIGGTIDNAIDRPMNWALYYCDFGRFGSPLPARNAGFVSDINVSYKREAIESVRDIWREAYHETTVHWAMRERGIELRLDPRLKVYQHRPPMTFAKAFRERIEWGRVFAETRIGAIGFPRGIFFILAVPLLPAVLLARVAKHMLRQRRTFSQMVAALPLAAGLLIGWAWGELSGYMSGPVRRARIERISDWNAGASHPE